MKVIGLDLSLTSTGWATWDDHEDPALEFGTFGEGGHREDTLTMRQRRIVRATDRVTALAQYADLAVVEAHSFAGKGGSQHDRSGLWWIAVNDLMSFGVPVLEVAPSSLKQYVTGKGNASKMDMVLAQARRFPHLPIKKDDEADALGLVLIGLRILDPQTTLDGALTAAQAKSFEKIRLTPFRE